jgi:hypothetical protein
MKNRYVYGLFRPDNGQIFYIGIGQGNRAWTHIKNRKREICYKNNVICKMIDELGYAEIPVVIFRDNLSREEASNLEEKFISNIGRHPYGPLTNVLKGGDDRFDPPPETRIKMSLAKKGKIWITNGISQVRIFPSDTIPQGWRRGRVPFSDAAKAKMSVVATGRKNTEESKRKNGAAHLGKKRNGFNSNWWKSPEGLAHSAKLAEMARERHARNRLMKDLH